MSRQVSLEGSERVHDAQGGQQSTEGPKYDKPCLEAAFRIRDCIVRSVRSVGSGRARRGSQARLFIFLWKTWRLGFVDLFAFAEKVCAGDCSCWRSGWMQRGINAICSR